VPADVAAELFRRVSGPDDDTTTMQVGGITAPKPAQWTWQQPTMQFRTLQYAVPAPGESSGSAELIVSVFLEGDGGPTETNIDRWVGQFRSAEGGTVEANIAQWNALVEGLRDAAKP
jgi:hypothetical protein